MFLMSLPLIWKLRFLGLLGLVAVVSGLTYYSIGLNAVSPVTTERRPNSVQGSLLAMGGGMPDIQDLGIYADQLSQNDKAFNGFVINNLIKNNDSKNFDLKQNFPWGAMQGFDYKYDDFAKDVERLNQLKNDRLSKRYLRLNLSTPNNISSIDWFNDAQWEVIRFNMGIVGKIIAEAKLEGLMLDTEEYNATNKIFILEDLQKRYPGKTREELVEKIEQRGAQLMAALNLKTIDRKITMMFTFANSYYALQNVDPKNAPTLLPNFLDGLIHNSPNNAVFVDASEAGYMDNKNPNFFTAYATIAKEKGHLYSRYPNEYKNVRLGFGLKMDKELANHNNSAWCPDISRVAYTNQEFAYALKQAYLASDGYLWVYNSGLVNSRMVNLWTGENMPQKYYDALIETRRFMADTSRVVSAQPTRTLEPSPCLPAAVKSVVISGESIVNNAYHDRAAVPIAERHTFYNITAVKSAVYPLDRGSFEVYDASTGLHLNSKDGVEVYKLAADYATLHFKVNYKNPDDIATVHLVKEKDGNHTLYLTIRNRNGSLELLKRTDKLESSATVKY